jgi:ATP-dependent DNA helicase RecG
VAQATDGKAAYIRNRAFDKAYYKQLVIGYLDKFKKATPIEIEELLLEKLPEVLGEVQKKNKIRNLLQEIARSDGAIRNIGGRGKNAIWVLANKPRI